MHAIIAVGVVTATIAAAVPADAGQGGSAALLRRDTARPEGALVVEDVMQAKQTVTMGKSGFAGRLHLVSAALAVRDRSLTFDDARPSTGQVQMAAALRAEFHLDEAGRVSIHGGASTGRGFNGGWTTTGIGSAISDYPFFLKQLFVSATPHPGVTLETGGLYILRGESTEATAYDNDGYLTGERVVLARPFRHTLEQLSVTRAHLGDFNQANVLARLRRLDRANYYQLQGTRRVAAVRLSIDMTVHTRERVIRTAAAIPLPRIRVIDRIRLEQYSRLSPNRGVGYATTFQRRLSGRVIAAGGLSDIDRRYGTLNGDLYGNGMRAFASARYDIGGGWMASVQAARRLHETAAVTPRLRVDVALAHDLLHDRKARRE